MENLKQGLLFFFGARAFQLILFLPLALKVQLKPRFIFFKIKTQIENQWNLHFEKRPNVKLNPA